MRLWTKTIDINFFTVRKQLKHFVIYHAQTRDTCREMKVWSNVRSLSRSRRLSRSKQKIVWPSCWTKKAERMIALNERERGQGRSKKSEWYRPYIAKGLNWKRKGRNSEVVQEVLSIIFIQNLHSNHHLKKRGKLSGWVRAGWAGCERANRKDNNNKKNWRCARRHGPYFVLGHQPYKRLVARVEGVGEILKIIQGELLRELILLRKSPWKPWRYKFVLKRSKFNKLYLLRDWILEDASYMKHVQQDLNITNPWSEWFHREVWALLFSNSLAKILTSKCNSSITMMRWNHPGHISLIGWSRPFWIRTRVLWRPIPSGLSGTPFWLIFM